MSKPFHLPNPLRSRNKWAVRGRALGHFLCSLLFTISDYLVRLLEALFRWIWRACRERRAAKMVAAPTHPAQPIHSPAYTDAIAIVADMVKDQKRAESLVEQACRSLPDPENPVMEDLVRAAMKLHQLTG